MAKKIPFAYLGGAIVASAATGIGTVFMSWFDAGCLSVAGIRTPAGLGALAGFIVVLILAVRALIVQGHTRVFKITTVFVCSAVLLCCSIYFLYLLLSLAVSSKMTIATLDGREPVELISRHATQLGGCIERATIGAGLYLSALAALIATIATLLVRPAKGAASPCPS